MFFRVGWDGAFRFGFGHVDFSFYFGLEDVNSMFCFVQTIDQLQSVIFLTVGIFRISELQTDRVLQPSDSPQQRACNALAMGR